MAKQENLIVQDVFTVKRKELLTPHYIRIVLTGNVALFKDATLGDNNKVFVPPAGLEKVHMRYYDQVKKEWILPQENVRPSMRTYTHRAIDLDKNELTIDFVNHGLNGPASAWANTAKEGAELGVAMKLSKKELFPVKSNYLFVGDATAIPIIGVILEQLPKNVKGICLLEVHSKKDEQELRTAANIDFRYIYNSQPELGSRLADELKTIVLPLDSKFAYVACEFNSVKTIRQYLRKEKKWAIDELYAYSYWKRGQAEDESADSRRKEKGY